MAKHVFSSASDCIAAFVAQTTDHGRSGNVFFENDVIYSYGYHFPMAVRLPNGLFVCNGDKYSVTTSSHQSQLFQTIGNRSRCEIPFSALANLSEGGRWNVLRVVQELKLLDWQNDQYIDTGRVSERTGATIWEHVLGAVLFTYKGQHWLSGLDETGVRGRLFFLTRLSPAQMRKYGRPKTVAEAFELLKPDEVKAAELAGRRVYRQGEWFFVEFEPTYYDYVDPKQVKKGYVLQHRDRKREARHHATEGVRVPNLGQFVRGVVRHGMMRQTVRWNGEVVRWRDRSEHKQLKLYEEGTKPKDRKWFQVFESPQVISFAATGAVD